MGLRPEPDTYWITRVESLAPRNDTLSWLRVGWVERWNRWVVYQCIPNYAVRADLWDASYDPESRFWSRRQLDRGLMTKEQYAIFDETGCYPSLWWVVQGSRGGHRRQWLPVESKLLEVNGFPGKPPQPGELPYAPVDRRVFDAIGPLDKLQRWQGVTDYCFRNQAQLELEEREEAIHANYELWKLMQRQADEWLDFGRHEFRSLFDQLPKGRAANRGRRALDYERDEQELIETV